MAQQLCVVFVVLVALCNLSTASLLSNSQTVNATYVPLARPPYIPSNYEGTDFGSLISIGDNVYWPVSFDLGILKWQSYLYELNLQLELTATLNLTYVDSASGIGSYSTFGNSFNKQIYMLSEYSIVQVDSTSMSVVASQQYNGFLYDGFSNYEGTEVFFLGEYGLQNGFLVLNASGLAMINFYPLDLPSGDQWVVEPSCMPSNNNPTLAYCFAKLYNGHEDVSYIFSFSLTTFKLVNSIEVADFYTDDITVAYEGFSATVDLFILSYYQVGQRNDYFFNLTGYTSDLNEVWQVELPSNTSVYGLISVGNSVVVSIVQAGTNENILLEYDASTGQLIGQWTNTTPSALQFYDSNPLPVFESNGVWEVIALGLPNSRSGYSLVDVQVSNN